MGCMGGKNREKEIGKGKERERESDRFDKWYNEKRREIKEKMKKTWYCEQIGSFPVALPL